MARKFNMGRQGEQLLNEEWHSLFMALKFLNSSRYNDEGDVKAERQTPIPNHALRLSERDDLGTIEIYRYLDKDTKETSIYYGHPNTVEFYDQKTATWATLFDGYFHPASAVKPEIETNVAPYQLCIDPKSGAIMYWDDKQQNWVVASAQPYNGDNSNFSGINYQLIDDLQSVTENGVSFYPVPYVPYGRLFSEKLFDPTYNTVNNCAVTTDKNNLSWVHVNASKIKHIERRLIKLDRKIKAVLDNFARVDEGIVDTSIVYTNPDYEVAQVNETNIGYSTLVEESDSAIIGPLTYNVYEDMIISITSTNTEFYGFKADKDENGKFNVFGELLLKDEDFNDVPGGIQLTDRALDKYKYVYCLTYTFDDYPSNEGFVIQNKKTIGGKNSVFIGDNISDSISLFIDGLVLEERGLREETEEEYDIYVHDMIEGTITFQDNDDADIINQMQMSILLFPRKTHEFVISPDSPNVFVDIENRKVTVDLGRTIDLNEFKVPMVFCSGLGLFGQNETRIMKDIEIDKDTGSLVIYNFDLDDVAGDEGSEEETFIFKAFLADTGDSYVAEGNLNSYAINDARIHGDRQYVVFANGILLTPTNRDLEIGEGYIHITNADAVQWDELYYVIFEVSNEDDEKIGLVYDDNVSYYSVRIEDNDRSVYDDCNCALVYIGSDENAEAGILLDEAAITIQPGSMNTVFKGNQITRTTDIYGFSTYYIHDYTSDEPTVIEDTEEIAEIERLIKYYTTGGSIQLLGDNEEFEGYTLRYFAYSYANMIDEPLVAGYRNDLPIFIVGQDRHLNKIYTGNSLKTEAWRMGNNSLSTYINGLIVEGVEIPSDNLISEQEIFTGMTRYFEIERPKLNMIPNDFYTSDIVKALNDIYNRFGDKTELDIRMMPADEVMNSHINSNTIVKDLFTSVNLFIEAVALSKYINEDMKHEHVSYVIEGLERDENIAAHKDFIFLETNNNDDHQQIFKQTNDTIETDFKLAPGTANVYINGVLLEPTDYCRFDNNKVLFNVDVCGLQQLPTNMEESIPDHLSDKDKRDIEEAFEDYPKKIMRVVEDKPYYIPVSSRDTILIEKRDDFSIRTVTFDLEAVSYSTAGTLELTEDFYDIPESLIMAREHVKIYINGVYYDEGYTLSRDGGFKSIRIDTPNTLFIDPTYSYLNDIRNKKEKEKYENTYGPYVRRVDKITFEWR